MVIKLRACPQRLISPQYRDLAYHRFHAYTTDLGLSGANRWPSMHRSTPSTACPSTVDIFSVQHINCSSQAILIFLYFSLSHYPSTCRMSSTALQLHSGHRNLMQIVQYISPLRRLWQPAMNAVCIRILPMPHRFDILRPFCRKHCIVSSNFSSVGSHLLPVTTLLREHIPPRHRLLHPDQRVTIHRGHSIAQLLQPPLSLMPQACRSVVRRRIGRTV